MNRKVVSEYLCSVFCCVGGKTLVPSTWVNSFACSWRAGTRRCNPLASSLWVLLQRTCICKCEPTSQLKRIISNLPQPWCSVSLPLLITGENKKQELRVKTVNEERTTISVATQRFSCVTCWNQMAFSLHGVQCYKKNMLSDLGNPDHLSRWHVVQSSSNT